MIRKNRDKTKNSVSFYQSDVRRSKIVL